MGPSRAVVTARLGTLPRAAWRTGIDGAVTAVVDQPSLWLAGSLGFLLRGGVVVLVAPLLVLPTPIDIRAFLGSNLGSAGFSPALVQAAGVLGVLALVTVMAGLALLAWLELAAFEKVVGHAELATQRDGRPLVRLAARARRRLIVDLFAIQWAAFALIALACVPIILAGYDLTYREIMRPSGGESLYVRIASALGEPLFLFAAGLVVVEILAATASRSLITRRLLAPRDPAVVAPREGLGRVFLDGLRMLLTALLGWSLAIALVVPVLWALSLAWQQVRTTLLLPGATDPGLSGLLAAGLLAAVWVAGILLAGFVSALRSALWSVESVR